MNMYQNMQSQGLGYYYNPYAQPSLQQPQYSMRADSQTAYPVTPSASLIKGRPVSSFEEARAAQIDLDGSLFVFPDIGNKKIYTKQINLDGTASLHVYSLEPDTRTIETEYVTKAEFNQALAQIQTFLNQFQQPAPVAAQKEEKKNISF